MCEIYASLLFTDGKKYICSPWAYQLLLSYFFLMNLIFLFYRKMKVWLSPFKPQVKKLQKSQRPISGPVMCYHSFTVTYIWGNFSTQYSLSLPCWKFQEKLKVVLGWANIQKEMYEKLCNRTAVKKVHACHEPSLVSGGG